MTETEIKAITIKYAKSDVAKARRIYNERPGDGLIISQTKLGNLELTCLGNNFYSLNTLASYSNPFGYCLAQGSAREVSQILADTYTVVIN